MQLFLDANAHIPLNRKAQKAFIDFENSIASSGHPLATNLPGRAAASAIEQSREKIASLIGAKNPNQIIFCHSASQAAEWGLNIFAAINTNNKIIKISPVEHSAIYDAFNKELPTYHDNYFAHNENGIYKEEQAYVKLEKVICIHVQNETGIIQPLKKIKRQYLFTDMSQSLGKIPIDLEGVDIAIFGAHKFGGPAGVGFIYLRDTSWWKEYGTGSRYSLDIPGTPNTAGIVGSAEALEDALKSLPERANNMIEFKAILEGGLKELNIEIIAENEDRCPNTSFIRVPEGKAPYLMNRLGNDNIYVGLGSACSSINPINVMMDRLGKSCNAYDFLRISQWGNYGKEEAKYFLSEFRRLL